jgi:DnaK suppressor protein
MAVKDCGGAQSHDGCVTFNQPSTPTMTQLDTTPFKAQLLEQRASLLAQLSTLRGGPVGRAEASADHFSGREESSAHNASARELEFALDDRETGELEAVEAALQRIEAGTYGQCADCGVQIPPARLAVAPEATRCISCQGKAEHA